MQEHNYTPIMHYPAEGRCDVAADLEEERLLAYSAHHRAAFSPGDQEQDQSQRVEEQIIIEICHPAEGRCDVAADLEEELHDAYSAHHARTSL